MESVDVSFSDNWGDEHQWNNLLQLSHELMAVKIKCDNLFQFNDINSQIVDSDVVSHLEVGCSALESIVLLTFFFSQGTKVRGVIHETKKLIESMLTEALGNCKLEFVTSLIIST